MAKSFGKTSYKSLEAEEVPALLEQLPSLEKALTENGMYIAEDGRLLIPDPWQEACVTKTTMETEADGTWKRKRPPSDRIVKEP